MVYPSARLVVPPDRTRLILPCRAATTTEREPIRLGLAPEPASHSTLMVNAWSQNPRRAERINVPARCDKSFRASFRLQERAKWLVALGIELVTTEVCPRQVVSVPNSTHAGELAFSQHSAILLVPMIGQIVSIAK
jgi:hypothetical protein